MNLRTLRGLAFALAVLVGQIGALAQFKPTDIANCVWWLSPQGDPYATTSINPGGSFLDTGNLKSCKDGDYVLQVKDLSASANHATQATQYLRPVYSTGGRHGPYIRCIPTNRGDAGTLYNVRARVTDISHATGTQDIWVSGTTFNYPLNNAQNCYLDGVDGGWMYLRTAAVGTPFNWTAGSVGWTAIGGQAKTATYTGVAEGMQYLAATSNMQVSSAGGVSIYVAVRAKVTATDNKSTWFTHGEGGALVFGCYPDAAGSPKMHLWVNGNARPSLTLCPSHSPQIYSVRADNTGITFSMGDVSETIANAVAVPTSSLTPKIGMYRPTVSPWYGSGDYYSLIVFSRKLTDGEHTQVIDHLRDVTDIQEYTGLLTVPGYSIWEGYNAPDARFWELLDVERLGYEVRVNALPGITQSQIKTNVLATTGSQAFTAPYVNQSNYQAGRKYALLAGLTNNFTPNVGTPALDDVGDVPAAMTSLQATIAALAGQGHKVILTTDVDKYTGTSQWRTDIDGATPLIRQLGLPVIDFAANTRLGADGAAQNQVFMYAGYVHPNGAGHKLMAAEAERVLMPILNATPNWPRNRN